MNCPRCNKSLETPHEEEMEYIHPWIILPFYKLEKCITKEKLMIQKCECGYLRIIK